MNCQKIIHVSSTVSSGSGDLVYSFYINVPWQFNGIKFNLKIKIFLNQFSSNVFIVLWGSKQIVYLIQTSNEIITKSRWVGMERLAKNIINTLLVNIKILLFFPFYKTTELSFERLIIIPGFDERYRGGVIIQGGVV